MNEEKTGYVFYSCGHEIHDPNAPQDTNWKSEVSCPACMTPEEKVEIEKEAHGPKCECNGCSLKYPWDSQEIIDAQEEMEGTKEPSSGKSDKVLVVDDGKSLAPAIKASQAAQNLSAISQMVGGPSIEEIVDKIVKKPSGKPQKSGGPILTGKRLEKLRKSCQKK